MTVKSLHFLLSILTLTNNYIFCSHFTTFFAIHIKARRDLAARVSLKFSFLARFYAFCAVLYDKARICPPTRAKTLKSHEKGLSVKTLWRRWTQTARKCSPISDSIKGVFLFCFFNHKKAIKIFICEIINGIHNTLFFDFISIFIKYRNFIAVIIKNKIFL